jgi:hypothetical protein
MCGLGVFHLFPLEVEEPGLSTMKGSKKRMISKISEEKKKRLCDC